MSGLREQMTRFRAPLLVSGFVLLIMLAASAWAWHLLARDARIPVHWSLTGEVDRYGGKFEGLLMLPLILAGVALLFTALPFLEPRARHLKLSHKAFGALWVGTVLFFAAVHLGMVAKALGKSVDVPFMSGLASGLMMMVLGNYMGKLRSNFFIGIRTPWTLSSELSWSKTHRLGGWLFVLLGGVFTISTLFGVSVFFKVLTPGVLTMVVVLFVYSYVIWKSDPNKQETGR